MAKTKSSATYAYPETVPGSGTRLGTASQALEACETLVEDNLSGVRGHKRAQQMGMFHGNPPFSPTDQVNRGRRWQTNVSTRIAESLLEAACVPYYNLFEGGPAMSVIKLKNPNRDEADRKSRIATKHWNRALKRLALSDPFYRTARSFVGFGSGFWWWPNPISWKPQCKASHEVLFPKGASTDFDRLEFFATRVKMNPSELYANIRDREKARSSGWNPDEVMRVLQRASTIDPASTTATQDYIQFQQELHSHDLTTTSQTGQVDMIYVYGKEWDGSWTMGVVDRHSIYQRPGQRSPDREWMFLRKNYAKRIEELIVPFIYDPADGSMNGVEGLASEIYSMVMLFDRMFCKISDGGFIRSLMALTSRSTTGTVDGSVTVRGGVIHLPRGAEAVNAQAFADLNGPIAVARLILEMIGKVSGVHLPSSDRPVGNPDTAAEARMKYQQRAVLSASGISRFYTSLDMAYPSMFDRCIRTYEIKPDSGYHYEVAKDFIDACKEEGVTLKELKDYICVKAYRVSGGGSNMEQQAALGMLSPLAGAMPTAGRYKFFDELTASTVGPDKVDEFWPKDIDEPGEPQWEATVENQLAMGGSQPMLTGGQVHELHLGIHIQALAQGLSSVEQGADAASVMAFGAIMLPHAEQTLGALSTDPTAREKVNAFKQQLAVVKQGYGRLQQVVAEQRQQQQDMARAQAVQQGLDPKLRLQAAEKQARTQLKAQQQAANMQMSQAKHMQEMRQSEEDHQQELRQKAESYNSKALPQAGRE